MAAMKREHFPYALGATVLVMVAMVVIVERHFARALRGGEEGGVPSAQPQPPPAPQTLRQLRDDVHAAATQGQAVWSHIEQGMGTPVPAPSASAAGDGFDPSDKERRWRQCEAMHGVPVVGFGYTVVCIDEEHVQVIDGKRY